MKTFTRLLAILLCLSCGAAPTQQMLLAGRVTYRYWRLTTDAVGSGAVGIGMSEWKLVDTSGNAVTLTGKTVTNLGGGFDPTFVLANLTDGAAETANSGNLCYNTGAFDIYVDMTAPITASGFDLAPQGNNGSGSFNNPLTITIQGSNDASTWTTLASFTSISSGYPNWNPGTYRRFSF